MIQTKSLAPNPPTMPRDRLPRWLRLWGLLNAPPAVYLLLVYFWGRFPITRVAKPLPGFGSFEGGPLTMLLLLPFLGCTSSGCWWWWSRPGFLFAGNRPCLPSRWVAILGSLLLLALAWTDESTWDRFSVSKLARSPEAGDRFLHAVVEGNVGTVRAFLPTASRSTTAISGGPRFTRPRARGERKWLVIFWTRAPTSTRSMRISPTPVDVAESQHHDDIVALLRARGGKEYNEFAPANRQAPCPVTP